MNQPLERPPCPYVTHHVALSPGLLTVLGPEDISKVENRVGEFHEAQTAGTELGAFPAVTRALELFGTVLVDGNQAR